jgi:hypothetical protein
MQRQTESQISNGSCSCHPSQEDPELYRLEDGKCCWNSTWAVERILPVDVTRRKRELDVPWSMEPMRDGDGEDWSVERTDWLTFTLTLH